MIKHLLIICTLIFCPLLFAQDLKHPGIIFLSKDNGETWEQADNGIPWNAVVKAIVEKEDLVLVATENHGVYGSLDQLQSWHPLNQGLLQSWHPLNHGLPVKKVDALYEYRGNIFAGTYKHGIFMSEDEGSSWRSFNDGLTNLTMRAFFVYDHWLLAGTNDGIFVLNDNKWIQKKAGLQINDFAKSGDQLFVATNKGVLVSSSHMENWQMILKDTAIHSFTKVDEMVIGKTYFSEWIRIDKNGGNWTDIFVVIPKPVVYSMIRTDDYILAQMQTGFFKSYDQGKSWQKIQTRGMKDIGVTMFKNTKLGLIAVAGKGDC